MAPFDLNNAIKNVVAVCRNTFDKKIEINTQYYPDAAHVTGDANQIEQILLNICVNAAHAMTFMHKDGLWGGTLSITIVKKEMTEVNTLFDKIEHENLFEIIITDTGVGIEQDNLKLIFDPFFSTKPHESGTGLGLSMVFRTIKKHNGYLNLTSVVGKGTTFEIYFPVLASVVADIQQIDNVEIKKGDNHILIIDDEPIVSETARDMLVLCGYHVAVAASGAEGLMALDKATQPVELVILDMAMPEMSGKETFLKIRDKYPHLKVLLSSGNSVDERVLEVMEMGIDGFIAKPFQMVALAEKVSELLSE